MSKETLHLMLQLDPKDLETQIALQCAPLLTGVKVSNLLTVDRSFRRQVSGLFKGTMISSCILYESKEKTTFLLYDQSALESYLAREPVRELMDGFGYKGWDLDEILSYVSVKYEEHMEGISGFPHEIGLLLGYPPKDVEGFIKNNGRNFLAIGYWKVYEDLPECRRTFRAYNCARERLIHMISSGTKLHGILKVYHMEQRLSPASGRTAVLHSF